jgi:hypothetical protein
MQHQDILHETLSWLNADFPICTSLVRSLFRLV